MPYGHLIAATVMTLGVCQGHSSIASFSIRTSVPRGPSAIVELLVLVCFRLVLSLLCLHIHVMYYCVSGTRITWTSLGLDFAVNICLLLYFNKISVL